MLGQLVNRLFVHSGYDVKVCCSPRNNADFIATKLNDRIAYAAAAASRAVAWNAPFYRKFGFRILEGAEIDGRLTGLLGDEAEHGMPSDQRCAMRLDLR